MLKKLIKELNKIMAKGNKDWIKVTDRLPESEKPVEITFRWKKLDNPDEYWYATCNAFYEDGSIPVEDSAYNWDDYDDDDLVWDEFTNTWYVPRGWHEDVWFMEESYQIDETEFEVIAWKEKCKPYKEK